MTKLLKKEILLSMHPTAPMMLLLSAMVMIPNYPYTVIFFYTTLAIFFTCLLGRENNDVVYSLTLPIAKKDIVKARIGFAVSLQLAQMVCMVPFVLLNQRVHPLGNEAGMDANLALFAVGFLLYGLYNAVFFTLYYKQVKRVGACFCIASGVVFLVVIADVVSTHAVPFVRDFLDTRDTRYLGYQLAALGVSVLLYGLLTGLAYKSAAASFEQQDL